jgi:hypothetical protein
MLVLVSSVVLSLLLGVAVFLQLRHRRRDRGVSSELRAARRAMRSAVRYQRRTALILRRRGRTASAALTTALAEVATAAATAADSHHSCWFKTRRCLYPRPEALRTTCYRLSVRVARWVCSDVPGGRYRMSRARSIASIASSTVNRTVVSYLLSAPPPASEHADGQPHLPFKIQNTSSRWTGQRRARRLRPRGPPRGAPRLQRNVGAT